MIISEMILCELDVEVFHVNKEEAISLKFLSDT